MKQNMEWMAYSGVVILLGLALLVEGKKQNELNAEIPITGGQLLRAISQSQSKIQILDTRSLSGSDGYEDSHIPGAIPFPDCDLSAAPESARAQIAEFAPTIIVSDSGSKEVYEKCRGQFRQVRNLAGGMKAWIDDSRPEDSGDYTAPRSSSGGGCL